MTALRQVISSEAVIMTDPLQEFRNPLKTIDDIKTRCKASHAILKYLKKVKDGDGKTLYIHEPDNTYWVEEYPYGEYHGGGPSCLYKINDSDPIAYFEAKVDLTREIRKKAEKLAFWEELGEEEGYEDCQERKCTRKKIRFSVYCKHHHYEMIIKERCPF